MGDRIYSFDTKDAHWWCVPPWHDTVMGWEAKYGRTPIPSGGCASSPECALDPEAMRAKAEAQVKTLGVYPPAVDLPLDVYTLARNITSEFGDGTPEEKVAVALAGLNRAKEEGADSLTAHLLGTRKRYGEQIGIARPAATRQDPTVCDLLIASMVYTGWIQGEFEDITHGATHYLDRVSQDAAHARNPETPNGAAVFLDWSSGGDYLTWAGHVPNVRPWRLALLQRRRELGQSPEGRKERQLATKMGQLAVLAQNRQPKPYNECRKGIVGGLELVASAAMASASIGILAAVTFGRR